VQVRMPPTLAPIRAPTALPTYGYITTDCTPFAVSGTNSAQLNYALCSFTAYGGSLVTISSCGSCIGDTFIRLFEGTNKIELARNDDGGCVHCSKIVYTVPGLPSVIYNFNLHQGCYAGLACSGTHNIQQRLPPGVVLPSPFALNAQPHLQPHLLSEASHHVATVSKTVNILAKKCLQGVDPYNIHASYVVCEADEKRAWLSRSTSNVRTNLQVVYHTEKICKSLGYNNVGAYGQVYGNVCGKFDVGSCDVVGTEEYDGKGTFGTDEHGSYISDIDTWSCVI